MGRNQFEGHKRVSRGRLVNSAQGWMGVRASKPLPENVVDGGETQRPNIEAADPIGSCNSNRRLLAVACSRPERNQESNLSCDAPSRELDRLSAGAVEPLEVVDRHQDWG